MSYGLNCNIINNYNLSWYILEYSTVWCLRSDCKWLGRSVLVQPFYSAAGPCIQFPCIAWHSQCITSDLPFQYSSASSWYIVLLHDPNTVKESLLTRIALTNTNTRNRIRCLSFCLIPTARSQHIEWNNLYVTSYSLFLYSLSLSLSNFTLYGVCKVQLVLFTSFERVIWQL